MDGQLVVDFIVDAPFNAMKHARYFNTELLLIVELNDISSGDGVCWSTSPDTIVQLQIFSTYVSLVFKIFDLLCLLPLL